MTPHRLLEFAALDDAADADRAFARWCAEQDLIEDKDAPHGEAFYAGYECGCEDEYAAYLRSSVT